MARTEERAYVSQDALLKRLKRTEGQVRGIGKMIEGNRDCVSIVIQLKRSRFIDAVVDIEAGWMKELQERYLRAFKGSIGFEVCLSSEVETYSDETLELYFGDVSRADREGRNLAGEQYTRLFQQIGYGSIDEIEEEA